MMNVDNIRLKYSYKIHDINTARGTSVSANTARWYETLEDAHHAAIDCCKNRKAEGIVIYKAIQVIRPTTPPVEVIDLD